VTVDVLLADDQPLLRAAFRGIIDAAPGLRVVGEASTGRQAVDLARRTRPRVVLMDIRMPDVDGLAATRMITSDAALAEVRVLIITTFEFDEYVFGALRAGASGFIGKGVEADELVEAIRLVDSGESLLSPAATRAVVGHFLTQPNRGGPDRPERLQPLTEREREVLALVGLGLSNDDIAERLVISLHTARTHIKRAMIKLGAHDRAQLVVVAYETGLVRPPEG